MEWERYRLARRRINYRFPLEKTLLLLLTRAGQLEFACWMWKIRAIFESDVSWVELELLRRRTISGRTSTARYGVPPRSSGGWFCVCEEKDVMVGAAGWVVGISCCCIMTSAGRCCFCCCSTARNLYLIL